MLRRPRPDEGDGPVGRADDGAELAGWRSLRVTVEAVRDHGTSESDHEEPDAGASQNGVSVDGAGHQKHDRAADRGRKRSERRGARGSELPLGRQRDRGRDRCNGSNYYTER